VEPNQAVQWTARAEPLWEIVVNENNPLFIRSVETLAATDRFLTHKINKLTHVYITYILIKLWIYTR